MSLGRGIQSTVAGQWAMAWELMYSWESESLSAGQRLMKQEQSGLALSVVEGVEERTLTVSSMLNEYIDWPFVQQVFKLERRFTYASSGKVHHEIQYGSPV